jgi:hypothetical protein
MRVPHKTWSHTLRAAATFALAAQENCVYNDGAALYEITM